MNKQNFFDIENETEKKYGRKDKKRKIKMKVSGAGVKKIQKIIIEKNN